MSAHLVGPKMGSLYLWLLACGALAVQLAAGKVNLNAICDKRTCLEGTLCIITNNLHTACVCPGECPDFYAPVCASNTKFYKNVCFMKKYNCELRASTNIREADPKWCSLCQKECFYDKVKQPVCGSDGEEYPNICIMGTMACEKRKDVWSLGYGQCEVRRQLCHKKYCSRQPGSQCVVQEDDKGILSAKCVCPTSCEEYYKPVCGSDGIAYKNRCFMRKAACEAKKEITESPPEACANCKPFCLPHLDHQCGSDGKTYHNKCELQRETCKARKYVYPIAGAQCNYTRARTSRISLHDDYY